MKTGSREYICQQLIKGLTNAFFGLFMLGVLIFTVVSIRYQPPDPWLEPGHAITQLVLNTVQNATFQTDDSVLRTGEDFSLSAADNATVVDVEGPAITYSTVVAAERQEEPVPVLSCNPQGRVINCSDPGVLSAIVAFNLHQFPDLNFFAYQTPVAGADENQCDVAWKFRAKKEKSWRMYRDFRRFNITMDDDCNYQVGEAAGWHSGKNAKRSAFRKGGPYGGKDRTKHKPQHRDWGAPPVVEKNVTVMEEVEVIEDSVPVVAPPAEVSTFNKHKFLFYGRGGDHCKKMNQYLWSFLCAFGEAQYLNRTLVVDLNLCLSGSNNPGHGDEDGKDFRFYFDFAHLKDSAAVIEQNQFLEEWRKWNENHPENQASYREIAGSTVSPMEVGTDSSVIVMRKFELPEPDNYWYRVCEGETEKVVQRPWHLLWKSKRIMDIVNAICGQMEWDFDAVHVVRGEKAANKELWPNLDADTSVESLVQKLRGEIDTSRYVYIATNEREPGFFDGLKEVYKHAYTLDDFSALWGPGSLWYNQTLELTGGNPVEFDGYMRAEVDTEVSFRAKKRVETFGFLTKDCKDGVNTCQDS